MKKLIISGFALLILFCGYNAINNSQTVTKAEFTATHNRLKKQVDSILRNCDSLKSEIRAVRANTDTLKAGQDVIFRTMNENAAEKRSLLDLIIGR
ncbi:MAG: hypothetical protein J6T70_04125 [Bacteroidales bacterium]|nr:hypothetical protein [Bacteroidales bacterium]